MPASSPCHQDTQQSLSDHHDEPPDAPAVPPMWYVPSGAHQPVVLTADLAQQGSCVLAPCSYCHLQAMTIVFCMQLDYSYQFSMPVMLLAPHYHNTGRQESAEGQINFISGTVS